MPILGIIASAITGNLVTTSYESIETVTVGSGGSASVSFTSIPADYTHLQVRCIAQSTTTTEQYSPFKFELNSDTTGTNYYSHRLFGNGASVTSASQQAPYIAQIQDKYGSANTFSGLVIDVLDYTNTNKYTTLRGLAGGDVNAAGGTMGLYSVLWNNSAAITSITMSVVGGSSPLLAQYSQFALYGIKGS